jgi:hypothetical protein
MDPKFIKLAADGTEGGSGGQGSTDTTQTQTTDKVNPMETLVKTITVLADKVTAMDAVLAKLTSGKTEEPKADTVEKPLKNDKGELDLEALTESLTKRILEATGKAIDTKFSQMTASSFKSSLTQDDLDYLKDIPGIENMPIETQQAILKKRVAKKEEEVVGKKSPSLPSIGNNSSGKETNAYVEANKKRKGIK